jgi:hypothetical protein
LAVAVSFIRETSCDARPRPPAGASAEHPTCAPASARQRAMRYCSPADAVHPVVPPAREPRAVVAQRSCAGQCGCSVCSEMSGRERTSWSLPFGQATAQTLHKANTGCCRRLSDFCSTMRAIRIGRSPTLVSSHVAICIRRRGGPGPRKAGVGGSPGTD